MQIIDRVDFSFFSKLPKWIIGFSDVTVVHSHVCNNFSVESIHGLMPVSFEKASSIDLESLKLHLFGEIEEVQFNFIESFKPKTVTGKIVGGNLSILHTLVGTPSDLSDESNILLIEDTSENLMSIERMLFALKRSGKFNRTKALLVGDFIIPNDESNIRSNSIVKEFENPKDEEVESAMKVMILNLLKEFDFPICFGLPFGHKAGRNYSIYLGRTSTIKMMENSISISYQ